MADPAPKGKSSDKKILVVDDDDAIVMLMKTAFEIEGFQVKTSRDGRNVFKTALDYKPDLILTDLMMPGVGGYDIIRQLQTDPATSKVPILLMTGSNMDDSTKAMMKMESNLAGYFEKPVRPEVLIAKIHQVLNTMSFNEQRSTMVKQNPVNFDDVF